MQYLLTEAEYDAMKAAAARHQAKANEELQQFCRRVANELPVKFRGRPEAKPWGCIIDNGDWYCDECPAQEVCPYPHKEWSK